MTFSWAEHKARTKFVGPEGTGRNGVLLLGEAPGQNEDRTGRPFVGDAGLQLEHTLSVLRELDRKHEFQAERFDFAIDNVVHYRPPNNWLEGSPWESDAVLGDQGILESTINRFKPAVIVPTGNVALRSCIGRRGIEDLRGYVYDCLIYGHKCFVVPTFHPSYLLRGAKNLTYVHAVDIRRALRVARDGYHPPEQDYLLDPPPWQAMAWANRCLAELGGDTYLTVDIEKWPPPDYERITRVGFAYRPGHAMTVPFAPAYFEVIRSLYETNRTPFMVFWNADFDVSELSAAGFHLHRDVQVLDAMWQWHFVQSDIPKWDAKTQKVKSEGKKLGFVSPFYTELREFKSIPVTEPIRNATDVDAQITCTYAMRQQLRAEGRWDAFIRHWVQMQPILDQVGASGLKIDSNKHDELKEWFSSELARVEKRIVEAVPPGLRPVLVRKKVSHDGRGGVRADANVGDPVMLGKRRGVYAFTQEGEWCIAFPFLPSSPKQIVKYARYHGHSVPKDYKTKKDTTGKDAIEQLVKWYPKDPLYKELNAHRKWSKMYNQYIKGIVPDPVTGRVTTALGRTPSTWRFSSKKVRGDVHSGNLQNLPARDDIARRYREMFIASED